MKKIALCALFFIAGTAHTLPNDVVNKITTSMPAAHARTITRLCQDLDLLISSLSSDEQKIAHHELATIITLATTTRQQATLGIELASLKDDLLVRNRGALSPQDFANWFKTDNHLTPIWKVIGIFGICSLLYLTIKGVKNHFASGKLQKRRGHLQQLDLNEKRTAKIIKTIRNIPGALRKAESCE